MTASELKRLINDPDDSEFGEYLQTMGHQSIQDLICGAVNLVDDDIIEEDEVIQGEPDIESSHYYLPSCETIQRIQNHSANVQQASGLRPGERQFDQESICTNIIIQDDAK